MKSGFRIVKSEITFSLWLIAAMVASTESRAQLIPFALWQQPVDACNLFVKSASGTMTVPWATTISYTIYGGGGGGGNAVANAGGGGGSSALIVNGSPVVVADGGAGGPISTAGGNGQMQTGSIGLNPGDTISVIIGGGGGGGAGNSSPRDAAGGAGYRGGGGSCSATIGAAGTSAVGTLYAGGNSCAGAQGGIAAIGGVAQRGGGGGGYGGGGGGSCGPCGLGGQGGSFGLNGLTGTTNPAGLGGQTGTGGAGTGIGGNGGSGTLQITAGTCWFQAPTAPPEVVGLNAAAASSATVSLTWSSGGGTTSSYVYSYQAGAVAPATCTSGTYKGVLTNSETVAGLTFSTQYTFRVCAVDGVSSAGETATATTDGPPPDVTGLSAITNSSSQVTLNWTSGGGTTNSYRIAYQIGATAPVNCTSGTQSTSATTSRVITGLVASTQYSFRVCAVDVGFQNSAGVTVSATTDPPPPDVTGLFATVDSPTQITLNWTSGGGTTSTYRIAYQIGATAPVNCGSGTQLTSGTPNRIVTGLTASTQYSFRVCAVDAGGQRSAGVVVTDSTP